jgi:predicted dehydrogenase
MVCVVDTTACHQCQYILPVLVDKPVTSTSAEARELGELAKAKGLILYPFQNRRFDSDFLALKKLLSLPASSPQSIGDVVEMETQLV